MTKRVRVNRKAEPSPTAKQLMQRVKAQMRERAFLANLTALGVPHPVAEHRFHPVRKFRFDYAWTDVGLALEVDGGIWNGGGAHGRGTGIARDQEKQNLAAIDGWRILRIQPKHLPDLATAEMVRAALTVDPE